MIDAAADTTTNLGLAITAISINGNLVRVLVTESGQGNTDLNGDGDSIDRVPHVFDAATGTTTNLGVDGSALRIDGTLVALVVYESQQANPDVNCDGDTPEFVPPGFEAAAGITTNW